MMNRPIAPSSLGPSSSRGAGRAGLALAATLLMVGAFATGCSAAADETTEAQDELRRGPSGSVPVLADVLGRWSDFGVSLDDGSGRYNQPFMDLELKASKKFTGTKATTCADDGRGLCGDPVEGTFTYSVAGGHATLELTFTSGPSVPFVYTDVRIDGKGVLSFYRDSQFGSGRYVANRLVRKIDATTCGQCQDRYTGCVADGGSKSACRNTFAQCNYDNSFKNFKLAQIDCYPREATAEICERAQSWVASNGDQPANRREALKYSREILATYQMSETDCPL